MDKVQESGFYQTIIDQELNNNKNQNDTNIQKKQHKSTTFLVMLIINASLGSFYWGYALGVYNPAQRTINTILDIQKNDQSNVESLLTGCMIFGGIFGPFICMLLLRNLSRKNSLIIADIIGIIGVLVQVSYENLWVIVTGRIIQGMCAGINTTLVPIYIKEIAPINLIGVTSIVNPISSDGGSFIAFLIGLGYSSDPTVKNEYWRYAFAFPVITCLIRIILLMTIFRFDTPIGYLLRKQENKAQEVIEKIYLQDQQQQILQDYKNEVSQKKPISFKGVCKKEQGIQKKTFIVIICMYLTQFIGQNSMNFYSTKLFNYADNDTSLDSRIYSAICGAEAVVFATITSLLVQKFGKRKVMLTSYSILIPVSVSLGILYVMVYQQTGQNLQNYDLAQKGLWKAQIILLIIFRGNIAFGGAPPLFGYVGDIGKENQVVLGKVSYWVSTFIIAIMFVEVKYYISFFMFFANGIFAWVLTKWYLVETKGLSRQQISNLYN